MIARKVEMATRITVGIEVVSGYGNMFSDLNLPDAEDLKTKPGLPRKTLDCLARSLWAMHRDQSGKHL